MMITLMVDLRRHNEISCGQTLRELDGGRRYFTMHCKSAEMVKKYKKFLVGSWKSGHRRRAFKWTVY